LTADKPAISVLIAVRDGAAYLDVALASIAGQTFTDFEVVIVDNGSRDDTARIIAEWAKRDGRIRSFRQERPGLARTLNFAVSQARAPLLARLDADDIALPERFAVQHAWLQQRPQVGLLGSWAQQIDARDRPLGYRRAPTVDHEIREFLRLGNPFNHSSIVMRREAFERAGRYRDGLGICEDFDLWSRMAEVTELANLEQPLVLHRLHSGGMATRQAIRVVVADACIVAGQIARKTGASEPFINGVPCLRAALKLHHQSRSDFGYKAFKTTVGAARVSLANGDKESARRLRRLAGRLLLGLSPRDFCRGLPRMFAIYFAPNTRSRRSRALTSRSR